MRDVVPIRPERDWLHVASCAGDRSAVNSLSLLRFDQDAQPYLDDAWLIEDVLPERGLAVLFGAPGSRKTFSAIDLGLHIASGLPDWRGHRVERRGVIYLALEGGQAFRNRLAAWRRHHSQEVADFYRVPERLNLRATDADADRVVAAGRRIADETGA
ncbi:MAG: AAA family ATPase, partial [Pseudomonadota bacterium]